MISYGTKEYAYYAGQTAEVEIQFETKLGRKKGGQKSIQEQPESGENLVKTKVEGQVRVLEPEDDPGPGCDDNRLPAETRQETACKNYLVAFHVDPDREQLLP